MSDSTHELKIKVTTVADTSGLEQASKAVRQTLDAGIKSSRTGEKNTTDAEYGREIEVRSFIALLSELAYKLRELVQKAAGRNILPSEGLASTAGQRVEQEGPRIVTTAVEANTTSERLKIPDRNFGEPEAPHVDLGKPSMNPAESFARSLTPEDLEAAGKALEAFEHGQKIDASQKALIDSLAKLLQSTHSSTTDILAIIRAGHQNQEGLRREIGEIKKALTELGRRPGTGTQF